MSFWLLLAFVPELLTGLVGGIVQILGSVTGIFGVGGV